MFRFSWIRAAGEAADAQFYAEPMLDVEGIEPGDIVLQVGDVKGKDFYIPCGKDKYISRGK